MGLHTPAPGCSAARLFEGLPRALPAWWERVDGKAFSSCNREPGGGFGGARRKVAQPPRQGPTASRRAFNLLFPRAGGFRPRHAVSISLNEAQRPCGVERRHAQQTHSRHFKSSHRRGCASAANSPCRSDQEEN